MDNAKFTRILGQRLCADTHVESDTDDADVRVPQLDHFNYVTRQEPV